MKKILKIIGFVSLGIFLALYLIYLNLPYQKILDSQIPSNLNFKATIEPTLFGGLELTNLEIKYPQSPLPLLTSMSEFGISISWLSLLLGKLKINLSIKDWSDKNLGFQKTTIENMKISLPFFSFLRLIREDFTDKDPFEITILSDEETNDLLLDLDSLLYMNPKTKSPSQFTAKIRLKFSKNLAALEPLINQMGVDIGAKKNGYYHFELSQDTSGRFSSKPLK